FRKAYSYLNFNKSAKWLAHLAAVASALVIVALLGVLWLFIDLMVSRGRIPDYASLTERQQLRLANLWASASTERRAQWAKDAPLPAAEVPSVAAKAELPQSPQQQELLWQQFVWDTLESRVGRDAAERVFPEGGIDRNNHGALSLVVREE